MHKGAAWATRAFTPVFDGLWRVHDFAHVDQPNSAPSPTLRLIAWKFFGLRGVQSSVGLRRRGLEHSSSHSREGTMQIIRREFLALSGLTVASPSIATITLAPPTARPHPPPPLNKNPVGAPHLAPQPPLPTTPFPP